LGIVVASPALSAIGDPYDTPTLTCVAAGETEITLKVTAGPSGAPAGVSIQWMTLDDYNTYGWDENYMCKLSLSGQPSYSGNTTTKWELGPNQFFEIKIGSLNLHETGLSVHGDGCDGDLECGTTYVFRVFAHATNEHKRSAFSTGTECTTADCPSEDCTLTIGGYQTNGPGACDVGGDGKQWWPASVIGAGGMSLGTNFYSLAQLCAILNPGESGNCLRQLARQLIAAKFNVAWGASCPLATSAIACAEAVIGSKNINPTPSTTGPACNAANGACPSINSIQNSLNDFNNGYPGCPAHCTGDPQLKFGAGALAPTPAKKSSWGTLKGIYR
jgi:hypothetical protein